LYGRKERGLLNKFSPHVKNDQFKACPIRDVNPATLAVYGNAERPAERAWVHPLDAELEPVVSTVIKYYDLTPRWLGNIYVTLVICRDAVRPSQQLVGPLSPAVNAEYMGHSLVFDRRISIMENEHIEIDKECQRQD
jgi:hypothetical protein